MRARRLVLPLLVLAVLAGIVGGYVAVTGYTTGRAQTALLEDLEAPGAPAPVTTTTGTTTAPAHPVASPVATGRPLASIEIPRFGDDWKWAVVEGTESDQLDDGPGHYAGTPLPGDKGNVALAAHRAGHGSPFLDFDDLRVGDEVRLRQGDVTWTYRLTTAPEIIGTDEDWVLDALPGRMLTLTTCWPKYGSVKRMFVRAELEHVATAS